jgi:hypothetical protein
MYVCSKMVLSFFHPGLLFDCVGFLYLSGGSS